jgi:sigma-E factor negative regulatory protein RseA
VREVVEKMKFDNKSAETALQGASLNGVQKAQISDLADGQLPADAFADVMDLLDGNSQARAYWHGLHVAGDILRAERGSQVANTDKDMAFLDTFKANLAKELPLKAVFATSDVQFAVQSTDVPASVSVAKVAKAANDSFFSWKWAGGLSAAAAVAVFSWNVVSTTVTTPNSAAAQLAQSATQTAPVVTQTAAGAMLRNPQLDALIAAHNQAGGTSALQMPSGFLRSATFTTDVPVADLARK